MAPQHARLPVVVIWVEKVPVGAIFLAHLVPHHLVMIEVDMGTFGGDDSSSGGSSSCSCGHSSGGSRHGGGRVGATASEAPNIPRPARTMIPIPIPYPCYYYLDVLAKIIR